MISRKFRDAHRAMVREVQREYLTEALGRITAIVRSKRCGNFELERPASYLTAAWEKLAGSNPIEFDLPDEKAMIALLTKQAAYLILQDITAKSRAIQKFEPLESHPNDPCLVEDPPEPERTDAVFIAAMSAVKTKINSKKTKQHQLASDVLNCMLSNEGHNFFQKTRGATKGGSRYRLHTKRLSEELNTSPNQISKATALIRQMASEVNAGGFHQFIEEFSCSAEFTENNHE